jgi:branched-chain amino acid transport system ATP-binding protein
VMLMAIVTFLPGGILPWIESRMDRFWGRRPARAEVQGHEEEIMPALGKGPAPSSLPGEVILEVTSLKRNFRGLAAVKDLDITVRDGEILGLIGPNGSGKTTTFNLLSGFLKPSGGRIVFRGEDITDVNSPSRICSKGIGRTFQIVKPFGGMTVLENVMVGALRKRNMDHAERHSLRTIRSVGLWEFRSELANNLPIPLLKRLELAKALSGDPRFLLLDECMAGLNSTEKSELTHVLRDIKTKYGITMMIIEHDMKSIMSLSDRVIVLNYGSKIAEGKPEEITRNPEVISAYLGVGG